MRGNKKWERRWAIWAYLIFMCSVATVVLAHTFIDGYGFHIDYSISRYVGLTPWSAIFFFVCNCVVGVLLYRYLQKVQKTWKMSFAWWFCVILMLLMLIGLSMFPIGLFDEVWGNYGWVSWVHEICSKTMFLVAVLAGMETLIKFRNDLFTRIFGLLFEVYGFFCVFMTLFNVPFFNDYVLVFEWLFLAMHMTLLVSIPKFSRANMELAE